MPGFNRVAAGLSLIGGTIAAFLTVGAAFADAPADTPGTSSTTQAVAPACDLTPDTVSGAPSTVPAPEGGFYDFEGNHYPYVRIDAGWVPQAPDGTCLWNAFVMDPAPPAAPDQGGAAAPFLTPVDNGAMPGDDDPSAS